MRISKGYWIWGLFPSKDTYFLNEIKAKVQSKLKSPFFQTHITLSGPYLDISDNFLNKLKIFAKDNSVISLSVDGYDFRQEIYKSFFIAIKNSGRLKELRRNIYNLKKFDIENNYSPHISLTYGNHKLKEKDDKKHKKIDEMHYKMNFVKKIRTLSMFSKGLICPVSSISV